MATTHELATLGHVIKHAYEGQPNTNAFTDAEKSKLAGISDQATKNATDAQLRNRATHTGTQTAATIIDLPDVLATKVDAVPGKVLSDANFTAAEKDKLASLEDAHFKGVHMGIAGLEDAHPTAQAGDYAVVDDGVDLTWYQWDGAAWASRVGESTEVTPAQVKSYYESNPDTNAFTDAYKAYIDGVTTGNRFTWRRRGTWNAATNTPTLLNGTGQHGDFYVVTTAGTYNFGVGDYNFQVGDFVLFEGGTWKLLPMVPRAADWASVTGKPNVYVQRGTISPPIPAALLVKTATQSLATATESVITWQSATYDQFSLKSGDTLTIPSWATHARLSVGCDFSSGTVSQRYLGIRRNGSIIYGERVWPVASNTTQPVFLSTPIIPVTSGDVFVAVAWQASGAALSLGTANTYFQLELFTTN